MSTAKYISPSSDVCPLPAWAVAFLRREPVTADTHLSKDLLALIGLPPPSPPPLPPTASPASPPVVRWQEFGRRRVAKKMAPLARRAARMAEEIAAPYRQSMPRLPSASRPPLCEVQRPPPPPRKDRKDQKRIILLPPTVLASEKDPRVRKRSRPAKMRP